MDQFAVLVWIWTTLMTSHRLKLVLTH